MSKFSINTDKKIPSDEFIRENMPSFESVAGKVTMMKSPLRRLWQWGGGSAMIIAAAFSVYWFTTDRNNPAVNNSGLKDSTHCINAPIPEIDVPTNTYSFNAQDGGTFVTDNGTKIKVPALAFTDSTGKIHKGPVDLTFREFHKVSDFFRSGIPMTYDSAGTEYTFESAGMFEMLAFGPGGVPLQLAKGKTIDVDMVSYDDDPKFNTYYLDTVADKWEYIEHSTFTPAEVLSDNQESSDDYTFNTAQSQSSAPVETEKFYVRPEKASQSGYVFRAEYDKKLLPELAIYDNVLFQVDEKHQSFDPGLYKVVWSSVNVKKSKLDGLYILKLSRPDTTVKVYARPVFDAASYQTAVKKYNSMMNDDQNARADYKRKSDEIVGNRPQSISQISSILPSENIKGYRSISVATLGVFNCDYPIRVKYENIKPVFTENGNRFVPARIYWCDKSVNAMYETSGSDGNVSFEKGTRIVMWVVDNSGRMAVISEDKFAAATKKSNNPVFELSFLTPREGLKMLNHELYGTKFDDDIPATSEESSFTVQTNTNDLKIECFPNPASTTLNIRYSGSDAESVKIRIISIGGQQMTEINSCEPGKTMTTDVSSYAPGIYFCQLILPSGQSISQRFVRQ